MTESVQSQPLPLPALPLPIEAGYIYPNYWGGVTRSPNPPLIHSKLRDLRIAVGGIKAQRQSGGPMFPVKSAKDLANKLGQALCDLDLVAPVVAQEITLVDTDKIPGNSTSSGKPVFRTLAHVKATVRVGAADGSYVEFVGSGHGGDADDKAGGKATTYAWKDAILKGLTTPEQDMVDTDDEEPSKRDDGSTGGGTTKTPATRGRRASGGGAVAGADSVGGDAVGESEEGLAYALKQIEAATTIEVLQTIAANIKSGVLALAGADKLKASSAYVAKLNALKKSASAATIQTAGDV